jgi:uncharacterized membrane protein (DUF4010 family)
MGENVRRMDANETFLSLALALASGLVIGFEREQSGPSRLKEGDSFLGGARTHPLLALLGAVSMLLSRELGPAILILGFVCVAAFLVVSYIDDVRRGLDRGLTSEVAFLLSFVLGAMATSVRLFDGIREKAFVISAIAVVATLLLSIKPSLHSFIQRVSQADVFATLKFLVLAVVLLPLLPERAMGPMLALNPRHIGLMVVLIAGVSFVGYVAIRLFGANRGTVLTALVGGLVSSTAVTMSFSGRTKENRSIAPAAALAIVLASSIMFARVILEIAVANVSLVGLLAVPVGGMFLTGLAVSYFLWRRITANHAATQVEFSNPFELTSALTFAGVFALILLGSKAATVYFGTTATYLTGLLAGAADVDAITLSMAKLAPDTVTPRVAVTTILIGVGSNTIVKAVLATVLGGWALGRQVLAAFAVILATGAALLLLV